MKNTYIKILLVSTALLMFAVCGHLYKKGLYEDRKNIECTLNYKSYNSALIYVDYLGYMRVKLDSCDSRVFPVLIVDSRVREHIRNRLPKDFSDSQSSINLRVLAKGFITKDADGFTVFSVENVQFRENSRN